MKSAAHKLTSPDFKHFLTFTAEGSQVTIRSQRQFTRDDIQVKSLEEGRKAYAEARTNGYLTNSQLTSDDHERICEDWAETQWEE